MTTYLLHVTNADVILKLTGILQNRNYEISYQNQDQTMIVGYTSNEMMRMIQVNIHPLNTYLEINVHCTFFCKGTSRLTNDSKEEESINNELESFFSNNFNTFRLTPEDYVLSFV
jgi:hypothetical protein